MGFHFSKYTLNCHTQLEEIKYRYQSIVSLKVFWSSENRSFVFNQIFVYGTLMGVDYKSEKKI